jgi:hypothetical protein
MATKRAERSSKDRKVEVEEIAEPKSRKELISSLLSKIEQQLDAKTAKVTLADFIRLIQLQRELEKEEQPAEVIVTWRDVSETQNTV